MAVVWVHRCLGAIGLMPKKATRPNEDATYRQVGRLVVTFQALETELVQLASFALDPGHAGFQARLPADKKGRRPLVADLWFKKLVATTGESVNAFLDERGMGESEFRQHLGELLDKCRDLADDRNKVVHSAYLFLEGGGELAAIVRSDMTADGGDDVELDQELLTDASFDAIMADMATTALEIGQCRLQLIAWHR